MVQVQEQPEPLRVAAEGRAGAAARFIGVVTLALGVASSSLTFNWVIEHRAEANIFPEFAGAVLYLSDLLLIAGLAIWTVGWYMSLDLKMRFGPWYVFGPLLALLILSALSVFWAVDALQAVFTVLRRSLLLALYVTIATEAVAAAVPMVVALSAVGLLHALVALAQVAGGSALGLPELGEIGQEALGYSAIGAPRAYGLGFNPNPVGLYLAIVSALAYGLLLLRRGRLSTSAVYAAVFLLAALGLMATMSRSALLGWLVGIVVVSVLSLVDAHDARKAIIMRIASAALLLIVSAVAVNYLTTFDFDKMASRYEYGTLVSNLRTRAADWRFSAPIVRENFGLGVGAGNYPLELKERLAPDTFGGVFTPIHNVLLLVTAELGFIGGMAWLLVMFAPLVWVLSRRGLQRFEHRALLWLGPLLVLLFVSLLDFPPWSTQDGRVLAWSMLSLWAGGIDTREASGLTMSDAA